MLEYPIKLEKDGDSLLVTAPDLPEVTTFGDTEEEAMLMAAGAVAEAIEARLKAFEGIPKPSASSDSRTVRVDLNQTFKVELFWAMEKEGRTRADLARALGWYRNQVDRLFDSNHNTKLSQFQQAFDEMGLTVKVGASAVVRY